MGRRIPQVTANYTPDAFVQWNTRSRENLGVERLDLVQLHCPPTDLFYHPEVFAALDDMVRYLVSSRSTVSAWSVWRKGSRRSSTRVWPASRSSTTSSGSGPRQPVPGPGGRA